MDIDTGIDVEIDIGLATDIGEDLDTDARQRYLHLYMLDKGTSIPICT